MARPQKTDINAFVAEVSGKILEFTHHDDARYSLGAVREELETAIEELRAQNEELQCTRLEAEVDRRRYRELFHGAPDPYFVTDRKGLIIEGNRAAAVALEVPTQFLNGRPLIGFVARQDCNKIRDAIASLGTKWSIDGLDLRMRPRRGSPPFHASVSAVAVAGLDGKPAMLRWMMRDITKSMRVRELRQLQRLWSISCPRTDPRRMRWRSHAPMPSLSRRSSPPHTLTE
jgi:PAS domain S-box-containing protein